jgi:hypothetical protein
MEYVYYLRCMDKKRVSKDKVPRVVVTGRVKVELAKLIDRFLSKSSMTKSQLIEQALYDYISR